VAGLLHDIGRLVLFKHVPELTAAALSEVGRNGRPLLDVEREMLGFDHAVLGGMLLRKWRFPESLEQAVWRHHDPLAGEIPLEPGLVCVANMIAGAVLPGCSGDPLVPRFLPEVWRLVGIVQRISVHWWKRPKRISRSSAPCLPKSATAARPVRSR